MIVSEDLRADSSWRARAICPSYPPEWWELDSPEAEKVMAEKLCAECPVPAQCLAEALDLDDHDVIRAGRRLSARAMAELTCAECGASFYADARRRYCSMTCRRAVDGRYAALWRARRVEMAA